MAVSILGFSLSKVSRFIGDAISLCVSFVVVVVVMLFSLASAVAWFLAVRSFQGLIAPEGVANSFLFESVLGRQNNEKSPARNGQVPHRTPALNHPSGGGECFLSK